MTRQKKGRLSREDWILAGFRALSRFGVAALKVESLARTLETTKGSFYWHFKDAAAFEAAMLDYWTSRATEEVVAVAERESASPQENLRALVRIITELRDEAKGGFRSESAISRWAAADSRVARARLDIDRVRLDYLERQFAHAGFADARARLLGQILYAVVIGLEYLELQQLAATEEGLSGLLDILLPAKGEP